MLGTYDLYAKPHKPEVILAKPNKQIIGYLNEIYNLNVEYNLGGIHEVRFHMPLYIEVNHEKVRNEHVDIVRGHYKLKIDNEWFVITNPKKIATNGQEYLEITAMYLPYELSYKRISQFPISNADTGVRNATEILNEALKNTDWEVGYVTSDFATTYRQFGVTEKSVLDFLNDIAETYNGILVYDTKDTKTVSLKKIEEVGLRKGLNIAYGKYLKSLNGEPNFNEVCTRLYAYGKDGMGVQSANSTGSPYIEDFSYYMYPYNETITDDNGDLYTVNESSYYMSDSLCHAILKYNRLIDSKGQEYGTLLDNLSEYQKQLVVLQNEISALQLELDTLNDSQEVYRTTHNGDSSSVIQSNIDEKQAEINSKNAEIVIVQDNIDQTNIDIETYKTTIAVENNLTLEELEERQTFILEKKFSNQYIDDPNQLYLRAKDEIKRISQPIVSYKIDIVDFLKVVECQYDWDKLELGDVIDVNYDVLGISVEAKLVSIKHDYDNNKINIEISNTKDINNGFLTMKDIAKNSTTNSTVLEFNKHKFRYGEEAKSDLQIYIDSKINANKQAVVSGLNENYALDRRGLTLKDPNDPDNYLRALHNILAFTNDGGNTFKHAITPDGIVADYLYGNVIVGGALEVVANQSGTFSVDDLGVTVSDADFIITHNDVDTNPVSKIIMNVTDGIKVQTYDTGASTWNDNFFVDTDGKLTLKDIVIDGGSISWASTNKPSYSASDVGARPNTWTPSATDVQAIPSTYIDENGVWTGSLNADNIIGGTITADYIDSTDLHVNSANIDGTLVADRVSANDIVGGVANLNDSVNIGNIQNIGGKISFYSDGVNETYIEQFTSTGNPFVIGSNNSIKVISTDDVTIKANNSHVFLDTPGGKVYLGDVADASKEIATKGDLQDIDLQNVIARFA